MNDLLELQKLLLLRNNETHSIVGGKNCHGNSNHGDGSGSDEEIPSDISDNEASDNTGDESTLQARPREGNMDTCGRMGKRRRKRKHREWVRVFAMSSIFLKAYFLAFLQPQYN